MPTDNPKISLYVPQQIYDRFKPFQEEKKLSMSQAGIVILAEYFGIEETIKEIIEGTTIGGVTLVEFEQLKQRVTKLEIIASVDGENQVEQNESTSSLQIKTEETNKVDQAKSTNSLPKEEQKNDKPQLKLTSKLLDFRPIPANHLCRKRFGIGKDTLASYKRKHTLKELTLWTRERDPDNVGWVISLDKKGYIPESGIPDELLSKVQNWIKDNF